MGATYLGKSLTFKYSNCLNKILSRKYGWFKNIEIDTVSYNENHYTFINPMGKIYVDPEWGYKQWREYNYEKPFPNDEELSFGDIIGGSLSKDLQTEFKICFSMVTTKPLAKDMTFSWLEVLFVEPEEMSLQESEKKNKSLVRLKEMLIEKFPELKNLKSKVIMKGRYDGIHQPIPTVLYFSEDGRIWFLENSDRDSYQDTKWFVSEELEMFYNFITNDKYFEELIKDITNIDLTEKGDKKYDWTITDLSKVKVPKKLRESIKMVLDEENAKQDKLKDLVEKIGIVSTAKMIGSVEKLLDMLELDVTNIKTQEYIVKKYLRFNDFAKVYSIETAINEPTGKKIIIPKIEPGLSANRESWFDRSVCDDFNKIFPFKISPFWEFAWEKTVKISKILISSERYKGE